MSGMLSRLLARFRTETFGAVAPIAGMMIPVVAGASIASLDIVKMQATKSVVQKKADAALLQVTKDFDPTALQITEAQRKAGEDFLKEALEESGVLVKDVSADFEYNDDDKSIEILVDLKPAGLVLTKLFRNFTMEVTAKAAPKEDVKAEISLVLDVSGSMSEPLGGGTRMDALKTGVEELFKTLESQPGLKSSVSIIPYSSSVDITDIYAGAISATGTAGFTGANGASLADLNIAGLSLANVLENDHDPYTAVWAAERMQGRDTSGTLFDGNIAGFQLSLAAPGAGKELPVVVEPPKSTWCHWSYVQSYGELCIDVTQWRGNWYLAPFYNPSFGVMAQTDNFATLRSFMSKFTPYGGTATHIGAAWGLYSLTPDWGGLFKHPAGDPAAFGGDVEKILVIMTDGDLSAPTQDELDDDGDMNAYLQSVCALARAQDVQVYTVGLMASDTTDARLSKCAGGDKNYFPTNATSELTTAFKTIAGATAMLRLVK